MDRRSLLKKCALASAAATIVPRHVLGGPNHLPPSRRKNIALIGAGGRGRQVLKGMMQEPDVRVVAVADPAREFSLKEFYYRDVGGRVPTQAMVNAKYDAGSGGDQCNGYEDFRELLAEEKDLDAVICATPDHLHAFVTATCLRAGKHVYCEKPLTHNLGEARKIADLAEQLGLATQMGNQGHSTDGIRQTCEWIWAGAIGEVHSVCAWVGGARWNPALSGRPTATNSIPDGLNWDLWLGPRTARDFDPAYFPVAWRDFWAFGNSNIGDFACHDLDAACWALDLQAPEVIEFCPAGPCNAEIGPHGCIGYFHFPKTDKAGPVDVTWYDGGLKPPRPKGWPQDEELPGRGVLFIGSEGTLFCGGAGGAPKLLGTSAAGFEPPPPSLSRVENHARDWLNAISEGTQAGSHFGYGARLTEIALLGALSLRTKSKIDWDAQALVAQGLPDADSIIHEPTRDGWSI